MQAFVDERQLELVQSAMSDLVTLPFPLFDDTHFYHSVGRVFGSGSCMIVALADPFPVVRPWKECVTHFEEPRSPYKAPLRVTVSDASVARARARAASAKPTVTTKSNLRGKSRPPKRSAVWSGAYIAMANLPQ